MLEVVVFLSCLGPGPRAPFRAWLAEGRKDAAWLSTGSPGSGGLRPGLNPQQYTDAAVAGQARPAADVSHQQTIRPVLDFQTNLHAITMAVWTTTLENAGLHSCLP